MRYLLKKLEELLSKIKLRSQLNIVYTLGFFVPMACLGIFLIFNTSRLLSNYHQDLNESSNLRASTILFEITKQIYTISEDLVTNDALQQLLSQQYKSKTDFYNAANKYEDINKYLNNYQVLDSITIYSNNTTIKDYEQVFKGTKDIKKESYYKKAMSQSSVFWISMKTPDKYGKYYYNLCLVRKIPIVNDVLVIKVSENYLKTILVDTNNDQLLLYSDSGGMFFSSVRNWYDIPNLIYIDYDKKYYEFSGQIFVNDKKYMTAVTTLQMYQTDNRIYICSMDNSAYDNINQILSLCLIIIIFATLLPFLLIRFYTVHFSSRVDTLREAMHKASNENYDVPAKLMGEDEISQAFADLLTMVEKIKDKDAKMYEARISSQRLENAQQRMEMEVLASQINPHFLYNTLETIRMKAFKAGDKDVATAIKLLGKSMRYVLENTGTTSTTLKNELEYIETYLQIQRLRFSEKVNYSFVIEEGIDTEEHEILPLLIQPIVENAIVHGLEEVEKGGQIRIEVYTTNKEYLHIDISDNGCGMNFERLMALRRKLETPHLNPNKNIGLYNIHQRIRLCYGAQYGIQVDSAPGKGTKVSLILPITINRENI
ncbi:MAG TPA: histidine kinase [Mobilitalea sp.]|nr:histidine kinase [Mobilitalea sp.]